MILGMAREVSEPTTNRQQPPPAEACCVDLSGFRKFVAAGRQVIDLLD